MSAGYVRPLPSATGEGADVGGIRCIGRDKSSSYLENGGSGGEKVLTAGRSSWESARTNLVDELRGLLRAKDMALAEQRARCVKESVVFREQRQALAGAPNYTEKVAKLFGWADTKAPDESPRSVSPICSPVAFRGEDNSSHTAVEAPTGDVTLFDGVADVAGPKNDSTEELRNTGSGSSVGAIDDPSSRESPRRPSAAEITAAIGALNKSTTCRQCLQLQEELQVAVIDRTLAEAELISIRRAIVPLEVSSEYEPEAGNRCTNNCERPGGDEGDERQNMLSPSDHLAEKDDEADLEEEFSRLDKIASLARGSSVPVLDLTKPALESTRVNSFVDSGRLLAKELFPQVGLEATCNTATGFASSLSDTMVNSARHFEELARRRLLRLGAEADLRAARIKLEALLWTPSTNDAKAVEVHGDGQVRDPAQDGDRATEQKARSDHEIGDTSHERCNQSQSSLPIDQGDDSGTSSRLQRGRGVGSYQRGRGGRGGRGSVRFDLTNSATRAQLAASKGTPGREPPTRNHTATPRKDGPKDADTSTEATLPQAGKLRVGSDRRQQPATTSREKKWRRARERPSERLVEDVVDQPVADDAEYILRQSAYEESNPHERAKDERAEHEQSPTILTNGAGGRAEGEAESEGVHASLSRDSTAAAAVQQSQPPTSRSSEGIDELGGSPPKTNESETPDGRSPESPPSREQSGNRRPVEEGAEDAKKEEASDGDACGTSVGEHTDLPAVKSSDRIDERNKMATTKWAKSRANRNTTGAASKKGVAQTKSPTSPPWRPRGTPLSPQVRVPKSSRAGSKGPSTQSGSGTEKQQCETSGRAEAPHTGFGSADDAGGEADEHRNQPLDTKTDVRATPDGGSADGTTAGAGSETKVVHAVDAADAPVTAVPDDRATGSKQDRGVTPVPQPPGKTTTGVLRKTPTQPREKGAQIKSTPRVAVTSSPREKTASNVKRVATASPSLAGKRAGNAKDSVAEGLPRSVDAAEESQDMHGSKVSGKDESPDPAGSAPGQLVKAVAGEGAEENESDRDRAVKDGLVVCNESFAESDDNRETEACSDGEGDCTLNRTDERNEGIHRAGSVESEESAAHGTAGDEYLLRSADALGVLRAEVDRLRLEKAELEDTVAQVNVAAAQLFLVEYAQMKAKCKQLQRVVLGTDSRPTDEISRCGDSCQEVMHRLKVIGINFFRRRIGGVMGEKFFPDGLAKVLTLIGRPRVAQGCQTSPAGSGFLGENEASPRVGRRDAQVQVAGGIDAEDEPLMEQQVYALLGKLDLIHKRREDVLLMYHREAEEGAKEARALLAAAAAHHRPGQCWGLSAVPQVRSLVARREGPAGAPRPALNPTHLLFTAAVVLDSIATATSAPGPLFAEAGVAEHGRMASEGGVSGGSRRQRYSPAEKALLELVKDIIAALESEQRRSDVSAERRRYAAPGNNHGDNRGVTEALGRPPAGVPPLIWGMGIHLVGKLARAFRGVVEARGFEREVEDANLVAAVTLGRSPSSSAAAGSGGGGGVRSSEGSPWHLAHRMMSTLRGDEESGREREHRDKKQEDRAGGREEFDWGVDNYTHFLNSRTKGDALTAGGNAAAGMASAYPNAVPQAGCSKGAADSTRQQFGSNAKNYRSARNGRGSSPNRTATSGCISQAKSAQHSRCGTGTRSSQQPQPQQPRYTSAAVALVEAAAFGTVRPSRLHPRPASASLEGRNHLVQSDYESHTSQVGQAYDSPRDHERNGRPRPQSARKAEQRDFSPERTHVEEAEVINRKPVRPTTTSVRPASAGSRVVDTRTWSSNVTQPGSVFRCRPQNRRSCLRFDTPEGSPLLTHSGQVPGFLLRKERELAAREEAAAVNGRFALVSDGDEGSPDSGGVDDRGGWTKSEGERPARTVGPKREESNVVGGVDYRGSTLSSVRLEESMDGEGLLPDAGEQAFFDSWKPTGYGIDLSRYD